MKEKKYIFEEGLDPAKIEAIEHTDGALLIIAGPGSGKTKTLVEKVVYLITVKDVQPENILIATFTQKAANELITRISNRILDLGIKVNLNEVYIGTLHSIFLRILEEYREFTRLSKNYRLLDDFELIYFIYEHIKEFEKIENFSELLKEGFISSWDKAQIILKYVSKVSEEMIDIQELISSEIIEIKVIGELTKKYQELLASENCLDFTTIQTETYELLKSHPAVLNKIQEKIKYMMIDEYQDTNTVQEMIIFKILNPATNNICVVGDDDQGLYRFRGASIRNILEFPKNFKKGECKLVTLTTNYRSHPQIIDFYSQWINECKWEIDSKVFRYDKKIKPKDYEFDSYSSVVKISSDDSFEEWQNNTLTFINYLKDNELLNDYNQIAFLFKSVKNDNVIALAEYLEQNGINVFSPRSALFFERPEIKLMLGALIFIFPNLFDDLKWNENANLEIWEYYQECKMFFANEVRKNKGLHTELLKWCNSKAKEHTPLLSNTDYSFSTLFYQLLKFTSFSNYLDVELNDKAYNLRAIYNLGLLSKLLTKFEYLNNITIFTVKNYKKVLQKFFNQYLRFLKEGGIEEFEDFEEYAPSGCVSFMTIHQSKGLEFPIVVVGSLNLTPRKQYDEIDVVLQSKYYRKEAFEPIEQTKFFDFYRLFYTAFSRPQNLLVLSANIKEGRGKSPSKYFEKLFNQLPDWNDENSNLCNLELERLKPVNIKKQYAFTSDILLYENCPYQYKFYKELDYSPVRIQGTMFGTLVHQTIEDIHKAVLRGERELISDDNINDWFNHNYNSLSKSLKTYLGEGQIEAAKKQVLNYKEKHKNDWDRIKEAEVDVSLVKEDYILNGKIDLIRGENDSVEIIDFKSEKKKPDVNNSIDREKLNRYRRQLEVYAHIVEGRIGLKVSKMHLYYTGEESGNPYITYGNDKVNINNTIATFDKIVSEIEAKSFKRPVERMCEKLCGDCDMRFYCRMK